MTTNQNGHYSTLSSGFAAFLADVRQRVTRTPDNPQGTKQFILEIADCYAFVRPQDLIDPLRFLKQAAGDPPLRFGVQGFRKSLVDDENPARHYTAFVFVGFWLPTVLAVFVLWTWEILGFFRYRFKWSQPDIRSGMIGIRHGRAVRRSGANVLPDLIVRDLGEK